MSEGSGTYVGIRELARFLEERDVRVTTYAPRFWSPSFTLKRLLFNLRIASRLRAACHDWVVGFDLDGFHYGRRPTAPYVASIRGVIADELKNQRGVVRLMLGIQAAFERVAVRRARVVVATSRYSRDRIVEAYRIPAAKVAPRKQEGPPHGGPPFKHRTEFERYGPTFPHAFAAVTT